jgi:hypothetical protein
MMIDMCCSNACVCNRPILICLLNETYMHILSHSCMRTHKHRRLVTMHDSHCQ